MELNLWNSNQILQEWLGKHCRTVLKCDFEFDVANPSSNSLIDTISEKFKIKKGEHYEQEHQSKRSIRIKGSHLL